MPSSIPHDFTQLLQCPVGVRIRCHVDMCQTTGVMLDHHEHVQYPKRGGDSHEEITGKNRLCMFLQKCGPALITTRPAWRSLQHVLANCSRRDSNPELDPQLIGNPLLAPQGILA